MPETKRDACIHIVRELLWEYTDKAFHLPGQYAGGIELADGRSFEKELLAGKIVDDVTAKLQHINTEVATPEQKPAEQTRRLTDWAAVLDDK